MKPSKQFKNRWWRAKMWVWNLWPTTDDPRFAIYMEWLRDKTQGENVGPMPHFEGRDHNNPPAPAPPPPPDRPMWPDPARCLACGVGDPERGERLCSSCARIASLKTASGQPTYGARWVHAQLKKHH